MNENHLRFPVARGMHVIISFKSGLLHHLLKCVRKKVQQTLPARRLAIARH